MKSENTNGQPANMKQNQYTLVIAWTEAGEKGVNAGGNAGKLAGSRC